MSAFRKWIILVHRYLGILLGGLFVVWFGSGIGMMYAGGMPQVTPRTRLLRIPELDLSRIRLTPAQAAARAGTAAPGSPRVLTVSGRPAYRFPDRSATVFADDGTLQESLGADEALAVAASYMSVGPDRLRYDSLVVEPDQWTLTVRGSLPLHKIRVTDPERTELYVSPRTGEVEMLTTRSSRALAWVAAIPHWLYFTSLRARPQIWTQTILWASGAGCLLALLGILVGCWQLRITRPFRLARLTSCIPYSGWMRWHHATGLVFGVFTLTWVFSGLLSMQPFGWASGGGLNGAPLQRALTGTSPGLDAYPPLAANDWLGLTAGMALKEIEYIGIQGDPYFVLHGVDSGTGQTRQILADARTLRARERPFSVESLLAGVRTTYPDVEIVDSALLDEYDSYYYSRDREAPLPVLRVKFGDSDRTWFYIDPARSRLAGGLTSLGRVERWIYHGFHSLDFAFWYYNRPLWRMGVIVLSLGGLATSTIGLGLGVRRLLRRLGAAARL